MKIKLLLSGLLSIAVFLACNKIDVPKDTPSCIKKEIRQIEKDPVRNPATVISQYRYKDQTVYHIPAYCCNNFGKLYDDDCNIICSPDGGIRNQGDGRCEDFYLLRKDGKIIWQDHRK